MIFYKNWTNDRWICIFRSGRLEYTIIHGVLFSPRCRDIALWARWVLYVLTRKLPLWPGSDLDVMSRPAGGNINKTCSPGRPGTNSKQAEPGSQSQSIPSSMETVPTDFVDAFSSGDEDGAVAWGRLFPLGSSFTSVGTMKNWPCLQTTKAEKRFDFDAILNHE